MWPNPPRGGGGGGPGWYDDRVLPFTHKNFTPITLYHLWVLLFFLLEIHQWKQTWIIPTHMERFKKKTKNLRARELCAVMNHSELTGPHKQMQWSATSTPTCTYSAVYLTNHIPSCALACVCVRIMNANKCPRGLICALNPQPLSRQSPFIESVQFSGWTQGRCASEERAQWTTLGGKKGGGVNLAAVYCDRSNTQQKGKKKQAKVRSVITSVETN